MSTATVYEARRTRATRAEMEERAEALITLASANGPCSVRHLFYAATVAKVPGITKNQAGYDKVQRQVLALRRDGRIPYRLVVDGTRWMRKPASYTSAAAALEATAALYRRNLWATSRWRVEVWAESDPQGLPPKVTDRATLQRVAALIRTTAPPERAAS